VERAVSGAEGASPWVVSLTGLFTLELGGKRAARVQGARAREAVAESDLIALALDTRARVRAAAIELSHASAARDELSAVLAALREVERLERGRYQEAALASSELARTSAEVAFGRAEVAAAEREAFAARAGLAGALALPPEALSDVAVAISSVSGCAWADSLGADSLAAHAISGRAEVARSLGEYAAAEARVRAEVARQRPDLELGPGFIWDQGVHRWTLLFALPGLLGFRSRAPIVEAEAERAAAAAAVSAAQDAVLAETAEAYERCRGGRTELATADSIGAAAGLEDSLARAAYQRGETGRLEQARAAVALARAQHVRRESARRLVRAGLTVEAAAAEWRGVTPEAWPDPRNPGVGQPAEVR
jgi:outer membrane protein TolC